MHGQEGVKRDFIPLSEQMETIREMQLFLSIPYLLQPWLHLPIVSPEIMPILKQVWWPFP